MLLILVRIFFSFLKYYQTNFAELTIFEKTYLIPIMILLSNKGIKNSYRNEKDKTSERGKVDKISIERLVKSI